MYICPYIHLSIHCPELPKCVGQSIDDVITDPGAKGQDWIFSSTIPFPVAGDLRARYRQHSSVEKQASLASLHLFVDQLRPLVRVGVRGPRKDGTSLQMVPRNHSAQGLHLRQNMASLRPVGGEAEESRPRSKDFG